jgi:hypothetical protein
MSTPHSSTILPQLVDVQTGGATQSVLPPAMLTEPKMPVSPPDPPWPPLLPAPPEPPPPAGGLPAFLSTPPVAEQAPSKMMIPTAPSFAEFLILNPFPRTLGRRYPPDIHYLHLDPQKTKARRKLSRITHLSHHAAGWRQDAPALYPSCHIALSLSDVGQNRCYGYSPSTIPLTYFSMFVYPVLSKSPVASAGSFGFSPYLVSQASGMPSWSVSTGAVPPASVP